MSVCVCVCVRVLCMYVCAYIHVFVVCTCVCTVSREECRDGICIYMCVITTICCSSFLPPLSQSVCRDGLLFSHLIAEWHFDDGPAHPKGQTCLLKFFVSFVQCRNALPSCLLGKCTPQLSSREMHSPAGFYREMHSPAGF